nr:alkaline phosphatase family protein [uncultured Sphingomonas sp.]
MNKGSLALYAAAAAIASPAYAQVPPTPPKLIVAISVDQFSADLFDQYRPHFTAGMARLSQGTVFRNSYESHAATETCPGHSTLMTAWHPARTGIVANNWVDQAAKRDDKNIYCAEDETVAGSASDKYTASPKHLKAPTLGDLLKQVSPTSRNVAVAGKDRAAIMMSGRSADERWYWGGSTFVTDQKDRPVPAAVTRFNAALAKALAEPRAAMVAPAWCAGKDKPYTVAPGITVGDGKFARGANDPKAFRISPDFDGAILALSAAMIGDMQLGKGQGTDIISVGLSATDYIGHALGPGGGEMCIQMAALDQQLGNFFDVLDKSGIDYAVMLSADHGGLDIPERLADRGNAQAMRVDPALTASEIGKIVGGRLGLQGPVILGSGTAGEFWISDKLKPADRQRVLDRALAIYRANPQVYAAYAKSQVANTPMPSGDPREWNILQKLRASFDPDRSGDYMVVLKPYIMPIPVPTKGYAATHGSPWDYDRRVPIIFWRKGMTPANRDDWGDTVDIMPTLAAAIRLPLAKNSTDGRCLANVEGIDCPQN